MSEFNLLREFLTSARSPFLVQAIILEKYSTFIYVRPNKNNLMRFLKIRIEKKLLVTMKLFTEEYVHISPNPPSGQYRLVLHRKIQKVHLQ